MFVMLSVKARTVRQQMFERDANLIAESQYSRSEETRELSQFWAEQSSKSQNIGCFVRPVLPNTAHPVYTQQICELLLDKAAIAQRKCYIRPALESLPACIK
jgi:uncharacterized protein YkuJ